jgi:membrane protein implicated in regulation of membrane protease activity
MKPFTAIATAILAFIALGHLLRLVFGWAFVVHETVIPMWPSLVVVLVFGFVAVMLWRERGGERPKRPAM